MVFDSLWPHGLYSPWNSPGQNTGVGSLSLLQGIFPIQGLNPGVPHCRQFLWFSTSWDAREAQEYYREQPIPSPEDLSDSGIKPGSPAWQADSLPAEPQGKPQNIKDIIILHVYVPNNKASKYMRQNLIELQGETDNPLLTLLAFLSVIDISKREKIRKHMAELNTDRYNCHLYITSSNSIKMHTLHKLTWNIHQDILVIKHKSKN